MRSTITRVADAAIITVTGWLAIKWPVYDFSPVPDNSEIFLVTSLVAGLLAYITFPITNVYRSWRGAPASALLLKTMAAWFGVYLVVIATLFLLFGGALISRRWVSSWLIYATLSLLLTRIIVDILIKRARRQGYNQKNVVLIGYGSLGRMVHRRTKLYPEAGFRINHIMNCDSAASMNQVDASTIKSLDELDELVKAQKVEEVWLALALTHQDLMKEVIKRLRNELVKIRWLPDLFAIQILNHRFEEFMGVNAVHLNASPSPGINGVIKSLFDRAFAAVALVCLLPVFIAVAAAVKISSPGPIFFRQPRQGQGGKKFLIYKFRTMKVHKEESGVTQARKNDERITKIGSFLRKTSLDELPQFINVLLGDMSVVGPRPHAIEHNHFYSQKIDGYMLRHLVKPGITGWAQINGWRGETDTVEKMSRRVECDIYYINNWSFALDLQIIWRTAFKGWIGKNAY